MIYLDHGATSMNKPPAVAEAMLRALRHCGNPGRGGHEAAMLAARTVYHGREVAATLFDCSEEQVAFTTSCTHGLNIALRDLVKEGETVLISGFEHNAVTRVLQALGAQVRVAGRRLFDPDDTVKCFEEELKKRPSAAVFTHASNVFGYVLPVGELARLCRAYEVPFAIDAAQSAGSHALSLRALGAAYIAMPGHKGLLGPQGTGLLLCGRTPAPLLFGGTGSLSASYLMPRELPERLEAGTLNVPGIAGLTAGMEYVRRRGAARVGAQEAAVASYCAKELRELGVRVFSGASQSGTLSFLPPWDCEETAMDLARKGIALRAGLHCAPLAHESAGTLQTGTVRISFGHDGALWQARALVRALRALLLEKNGRVM